MVIQVTKFKRHILKWTTIFSGIVFLIYPYANYGKGTSSFNDSALYLVAQYMPSMTSRVLDPKGGLDDTANVESQIFDNTFMPLSMPMQTSTRRKVLSYQVQPGQTAQAIADEFGLKLNTVLWANNLSTTSRLKPGQMLQIPPVDGVLYIVKRGDTLGSISLTYKTYTESIIEVNGLSSEGFIKIGQELVIPGASPLPPAPKKSSGKLAAGGEAIIADVRGSLVAPAPGARRSQGLHWRNAVDLANSCGAPVVAAAAGTVIKAVGSGWNGGFGKYIMIQHAGGYVTVYGHLSQINVAPNQAVGQGNRIGLIGATGHATGCHVHFEVRGGVNPFTK